MPKKKRKSKAKGIHVKAKKKEAVARATIKAGKGIVKVNHLAIDAITPHYVHELIKEPIYIAGDLCNGVDIIVEVRGGGFMGQAIAARGAIAKALVEFTGDEKLRKTFMNYDRLLLVDDARRVESKKPLGPKARAKKQKSKR
ncbi:MAG: 30S ribosomal protein S9 [Candidatus Diapherotrites archaeon]